MSLKKYIEEQNFMNKLFKMPLLKMPTTSAECEPLFQKLECDMSPENLTCDGELSRNQVLAKSKKLQAAWKGLQKISGDYHRTPRF